MKTDPRLVEALDAAHGTDRPVEVVLLLRPAGEAVAVAAQDARAIAESAIERVVQEVGLRPAAVNVLANVGMVIVSAPEPFVRKLLDQPEFASAVANAEIEGA